MNQQPEKPEKETLPGESEPAPNQPSETAEAPVQSKAGEAAQEPERAESTAVREPAPKQARSSGRGVALLALLAALGVGAGEFYLWQQLQQSQRQQAELRQETAALTGELKASDEAFRGALQQQQQATEHALDQSDQKLSQAVGELEAADKALRAQLGQSRDAWRVSEVEYLLRLANQRLQLAGDIRSASAALETANEVLLDLGDPRYLPVRQAITEELQALHAVEVPDVESSALELSALVRQVGVLPLASERIQHAAEAEPSTHEAEADSTPAPEGWRAVANDLWNRLKELVDVRRIDEAARPLLAPEEEYFLRQNLRLKLETARLALLRGEGAVYRGALEEGGQWLEQYFKGADSAVQSALATINQLKGLTVSPDLPEISGSLRRLNRLRGAQS